MGASSVNVTGTSVPWVMTAKDSWPSAQVSISIYRCVMCGVVSHRALTCVSRQRKLLL